MGLSSLLIVVVGYRYTMACTAPPSAGTSAADDVASESALLSLQAAQTEHRSGGIPSQRQGLSGAIMGGSSSRLQRCAA
ncbi:MAG: hypothetical protein CME38_11945 [Haliea sp.]|nr:hypothetical protein [Haliea sp.]